jgi:hypothetical protein
MSYLQYVDSASPLVEAPKQSLPPLPKLAYLDLSDSGSPTEECVQSVGTYKKLGRRDVEPAVSAYTYVPPQPTTPISPISPSQPIHSVKEVQEDAADIVAMLQDNEQGMEMLLHRVKESINASKVRLHKKRERLTKKECHQFRGKESGN